jgi:glycosyltransferase involved in cell wall biosynthesis
MIHSAANALGISFDGLAISGIVNEFLNLAAVLRKHRFRILFDPGYDITLGRTRKLGNDLYPSWVKIIRSLGSSYPPGYRPDKINEAFDTVVSGVPIASFEPYHELCRGLASRLVQAFIRENINLLIIENGTLPDNPLFTEAIVTAIADYGSQRNLDKYVFWRDHDLMWSAEPNLYGQYPYPGVRRPENGRFIHYIVASEWMLKRMQAWAPSATYNVVPNRFFIPEGAHSSRRSIRDAHGIPHDAYLIARCTRVIPQKAIERDLRILRELQTRLNARGDNRQLYLFVTGPIGEDSDEYRRLRSLESSLSLSGQIIWGDGLLPFNPYMADEAASTTHFSISDLLAEANLSSFLTSYDYEGFGNPPGEAMAAGLPFIATTYELYQEVYGSKGVVAPLWPIDRSSSPADPIPEFFIEWTLRVLTDPEVREQIARRNLEICRQYFSLQSLERQIVEIFGSAVNP